MTATDICGKRVSSENSMQQRGLNVGWLNKETACSKGKKNGALYAATDSCEHVENIPGSRSEQDNHLSPAHALTLRAGRVRGW